MSHTFSATGLVDCSGQLYGMLVYLTLKWPYKRFQFKQNVDVECPCHGRHQIVASELNDPI